MVRHLNDAMTGRSDPLGETERFRALRNALEEAASPRRAEPTRTHHRHTHKRYRLPKLLDRRRRA